MRWSTALPEGPDHRPQWLLGVALAVVLVGCGGGRAEPTPTPVPADAADLDSDGYDTQLDCNDIDASSHPGADESCDGLDNDCDGQVDEGLDVDGDEDGFSACPSALDAAQDCDDASPVSAPNGSELCDGLDNDCDGIIDNGFDQDGDGFTACSVPPDCNDLDPDISPSDEEACDAIDNNCDGLIDENFEGDAAEPNDVREMATFLGMVSRETMLNGSGALSTASDLDWYGFSLEDVPGAYASLTVELMNIPTNADYGVSLFAENMDSSVGMATPSAGGTTKLEFSLEDLSTVPMTWQIQVYHRSGAYGCPTYALRIGLVDRTPDIWRR